MGGQRRVFTEESGLHLDLEGWGNLEARRVRPCIRRAKKDAELQSTKGGPKEGEGDSVVTAEPLCMRTSRENALKVGWSHIGLDSPPGREGPRALEPRMEMIKVVSVWGVGLAKLMMNPEPRCGPGEQDSRMCREGKPFQEVIQGTEGSIRLA